MCCGCRVGQCCCGCTDHKTGVLIWAIIDVVFQILYFVLVISSGAELGPTINYWGTWPIIVFVADILLAFGAYKSSTGLMVLWLVVMMIQIVLLSIAVVLIPIFGLVVGVGIAAVTSGTVDELDDVGTALGGVVIAYTVIVALFVLILDGVYIYFWIVVNSLCKSLMEERLAVLPTQQQVIVSTI